MNDKSIPLLIPPNNMIELRTLNNCEYTSRMVYVLRMNAEGFFFFYIIV